MAITYSTNPAVTCIECEMRPVAVINGQQSDRCAFCLADRMRLLGGLFSDFEFQMAADRLDCLVSQAAGASHGQPK